MPMTTPCALCGGTSYRVMHDMGWRRILRCDQCRLVRADPLPSLDEKEAIETQGYTDASDFPEVREFFANCHRDYVDDPVIREMRRHLQQLEQAIGGPGTLLDVGAGTGILMHLAHERGWKVNGIDICPLSAEKAAAEFGMQVTVAPFETHLFDGRQFDGVTMLDVLEHVVDPLATLRRVHALLRPGGAVAIAVPNQRSLLTYVVGTYARVVGSSANGSTVSALRSPASALLHAADAPRDGGTSRVPRGRAPSGQPSTSGATACRSRCAYRSR